MNQPEQVQARASSPPTLPTLEQAAALACFAGNVYVGAGPGTGKTFILIERVRALLARNVPAERILLLTFSRRAVEELRERIERAGLGALGIDIRTFHGFAARVAGAGQARFHDTRLLDPFSRRLIVECAIARTPNTPSLTAAVRASEGFVAACAQFYDDLDRLPSSDWGELATRSQRFFDLIAIARDIRTGYARAGGSDLGDLVQRAVHAARLNGSAAQQWLRGRYEHVLVDEFQDADEAQVELLELTQAQIFAVGDEAQSIYRFRGASDGIVSQAVTRFQMHRFTLTATQRCAQAVCELANEAPLENLAPLHATRAERGDVVVRRYNGLDDEARGVADAIERELRAGRNPREIGVLLRSFAPLGGLLVEELRSRQIPVLARDRQSFRADPRVEALRRALVLFTQPTDGRRWTELLATPALGLDPLHMRRVRWETVPTLDATLPDVLATIAGQAAPRAQEIGAGLLAAHELWNEGDLAKAARTLVRRLGLLKATLGVGDDPQAPQAASRLSRVCAGLRAAQRTAGALGVASTPAAIVARIDDVFDGLAVEEPDAPVELAAVRVLTVHAAKGLEFPIVFVPDAVHGRFPTQTRETSFLAPGDREFLLSRGVCGASVDPHAALREEASLWYVAVTRARSELVVSFAQRGITGEPQRPSGYIAARAPSENVVTPIERESPITRALRAGDASLRTELLAGGTFDDAPAHAAFAQVGSAAFEPYEAIALHSTRPLSVSDALTWLSCPRKVYYGRFLRLRDEPSTSAQIGTIVHAVLQRFHRQFVEFRPETIDVAAWLAALFALLEEVWQETFPTDKTSAENASREHTSPENALPAGLLIAAYRSAQALLTSYARGLGDYVAQVPFTVVRTEQTVEVPIGAHKVLGRLDRLDRRDDGTAQSLAVVDYKSGKQRASLRDVVEQQKELLTEGDDELGEMLVGNFPDAGELQLACYASAIPNVGYLAKAYLGGADKQEKRTGSAVWVEDDWTDDLAAFTQTALEAVARDLLDPLAAGTLTSVATTRTPDTCTYCAFAAICPGVREEA
jgi:superfamily I DNA/RNA helicase/RecB family exonuclease